MQYMKTTMSEMQVVRKNTMISSYDRYCNNKKELCRYIFFSSFRSFYSCLYAVLATNNCQTEFPPRICFGKSYLFWKVILSFGDWFCFYFFLHDWFCIYLLFCKKPIVHIIGDYFHWLPINPDQIEDGL